MKKTTWSVVLLFVICLGAIASCKKGGGATTSTTTSNVSIVGTWQISKEFIDTNNNGKMDASEEFTDTSFAHSFLQFNADGTFVSTYYADISGGTWLPGLNNTYLKITDTGAGSGGPGSLFIQALTATSLVLKDTSGVASGSQIS